MLMRMKGRRLVLLGWALIYGGRALDDFVIEIVRLERLEISRGRD